MKTACFLSVCVYSAQQHHHHHHHHDLRRAVLRNHVAAEANWAVIETDTYFLCALCWIDGPGIIVFVCK